MRLAILVIASGCGRLGFEQVSGSIGADGNVDGIGDVADGAGCALADIWFATRACL